MATGWEAAYQKRHSGEIKAESCVEAILPLLKERRVRRILDLGCGDGRHLVYLAKQGYEMCGQDSAPTALKYANEWLSSEGLSAELQCGDISRIHWQDGLFDAVICIKTIEHQSLPLMQQTFDEAARVLRKDGLFLFTAAAYPPSKDWKSGNYKEIGHHTYVPLGGHEKDVPHYFFSREDLQSFLHPFQTFQIESDSAARNRYAITAVK